MSSVNEMINPDLILKSRLLDCDPYVVPDFISAQEVQFCLDIYDSLPVFPGASHARAVRKDFLMFNNTPDSRMRDLFLPKLTALLGYDVVIQGGNFTTWHQPVGVHTDGWQLQYNGADHINKNNIALGYAVLVPLRTDTGTGQPQTIFFHQKLFGPTKFYDDSEWSRKADHFTNEEFVMTEEIRPLLAHLDKDLLFGFSVQSKLPWTNGHAIVWHRSQYHCAASYIGYNNKTHLIFFV